MYLYSKNAAEAMMDHWKDGLTQWNQTQKELKNLYVQSFDQQYEIWNQFLKQLNSYQSEWQTLVDDYQAKANSVFDPIQDQKTKETLAEFQSKMNENFNHFTSITNSPSFSLQSWMNETYNQSKKQIDFTFSKQEEIHQELTNILTEWVENTKQAVETNMDALNKMKLQ